MKITNNDYAYLKDKMDNTIKVLGIEKIKNHYENLEKNKTKESINDTRVRLMYDIKNYHDIKNQNELSKFMCDTLYQYINDTHITTALLKIGHENNLF